MDDEIKRKVEFYGKNNQIVHIKLKSDRFYNGIISEITNENFVIIDRVIGKVLVFYSEVIKIEPFESKEKKEMKNGESNK